MITYISITNCLYTSKLYQHAVLYNAYRLIVDTSTWIEFCYRPGFQDWSAIYTCRYESSTQLCIVCSPLLPTLVSILIENYTVVLWFIVYFGQIVLTDSIYPFNILNLLYWNCIPRISFNKLYWYYIVKYNINDYKKKAFFIPISLST